MASDHIYPITNDGPTYQEHFILCRGHEWEGAAYTPDNIPMFEVCKHCAVIRKVTQ